MLEQVSQPYIAAELQLLRSQGKRICYDGDLSGIPVSNTSQTYPTAAYGRMNDGIRLGYQAALVSLESPTYRRLWLSIAHHPGVTVSCTQAEARTGLRPRRRTELLARRIQAFEQHMAQTRGRLVAQERLVQRACDRLAESEAQKQEHQRRKESKQVFYLHHIKVRSEPVIYLQECCVILAANFIQWTSHWLADQAQPDENSLVVGKLGVRRQVQVAAHVSAQVIRNSDGRLLMCSEHSVFAGKVLRLPSGNYPPQDRPIFWFLMPLFVNLHLIA